MLKSFSLFDVTDREGITTVDRVASSFTKKVLPILPSQLFHAKFRVSSVTRRTPTVHFNRTMQEGAPCLQLWNESQQSSLQSMKTKTNKTKQNKTKNDGLHVRRGDSILTIMKWNPAVIISNYEKNDGLHAWRLWRALLPQHNQIIQNSSVGGGGCTQITRDMGF